MLDVASAAGGRLPAQVFSGQAAVVTGSSRGIGYSIARELHRHGASVCLTARHEESLKDAVELLGGSRAIGVAGRADDPDHQRAVMERVLSEFGRIDMLVNNAGISPVVGPLMDLTPSAARKMFEVNALAPLAWTQRGVELWMREHGGAIVNVCSATVARPLPGIGFETATKAMLEHLTKELAVELAPKIRVNAVAPAIVKTRMALPLYDGREEAIARHYPMARLGTPDDVGRLVSFLLSPAAGWITGQVVTLDGGAGLIDPAAPLPVAAHGAPLTDPLISRDRSSSAGRATSAPAQDGGSAPRG